VLAPASAPQASLGIPETYPQASGGRGLLVAAIVIVALVAAFGIYALLPKAGTILVTVAGPQNRAIDAVEIYVDDAKVACTASPCRVPDVKPGTHLVRATAAGYRDSSAQGTKVSANDEAVVNLELAVASEGTGVRVSSEASGLNLLVDGKEIGPLPQEIKDMGPGKHALKVQGNERYAAWEQSVDIEADKVLSIDVKPKVVKGLATIIAGNNAEDAQVQLVSGSSRRPVPQIPIKIDIPTDKAYKLIATRKGYAPFETEVRFEDGKAERQFTIELVDLSAASTPAPEPPPPSKGPSNPPNPGRQTPPPPAAAASGQGTLNINSIPVSNVILDGRPIGQTPKVGVSVSPGTHTVVFVHPEHGRKVRTVNVAGGKSATAAVRFP
jgi:hypothetical protein